MIKPSDVKLAPAATNLRPAALALVEGQFDEAIRKAEISGEWPAVVPNWRDSVTVDEIDAVVAKYKEAGWKFESRRRCRASILRP